MRSCSGSPKRWGRNQKHQPQQRKRGLYLYLNSVQQHPLEPRERTYALPDGWISTLLHVQLRGPKKMKTMSAEKCTFLSVTPPTLHGINDMFEALGQSHLCVAWPCSRTGLF